MEVSKSGYVYVLQMEGHSYYKIGRTVNLTRRIAEISPQMPGKLEVLFAMKVKDAWRTESNLHSDFKAQRLNGEWFRLSEEDLDQIRMHLLVDQVFVVTERLMNDLHDVGGDFESTVNFRDVSRIAAALSKSASRAERRLLKYYDLAIGRYEPSDAVLNAEFVL